MPDLKEIRDVLEAHGQTHLLAFYDQLPEPRQRNLLEQIAAIDLKQLDELIESHVKHAPEVALPENIEPVDVIPACPDEPDLQDRHAAAAEAGRKLLAEGKVAAFVVAGGQGTRLGYEGPKGCYPATPVARKPLFQVFAEQILAAGRRYGATIPWYVMTSPSNDRATRDFFRHHRYFGLDEKDVMFFQQGTMPAMDFDGRILLAETGSLALSPDGHGGSLLALRQSGALDDMAERGIEYLSYFQVDNPMVKCLDPLFLGYSHQMDAEMSAKVLPKRDPMEKLGNICRADGKMTVIEYSDMPEDLARQCTEDGRLRFSAGSIAIHVLQRAFVERITSGGRCRLPFHRAEKKVAHVDAAGQVVQPAEPNAVKLEMFVFDALPLAERTCVLETVRTEEFSPIKNAEGADSPATSLHDQIARAARWLEAAGVAVPRDADGEVAAAIEISPLFADDPEELAKKIDADLTIAPGDPLYLGSRGQTGGLR